MNTKQTDKAQPETKSNQTKYKIDHLMIAAETNDFTICKKILASNPNLINKRYPTIVNWLDKSPYNPGATALNYAIRSGHYDMAILLINKYNADIHAKDHENWNSLHYACYHGHYALAKFLLKKGVSKTEISVVEKSTPGGFAEYKHWNDLIYLFKTTDNDVDIGTVKQHNYGLIEQNTIFKKTKKRLDRLIIPSNSMYDQKLCRYYKAFQPKSCRMGAQCQYSHIDIEYDKLDTNKNIKLDLYLHRYEIGWNVYRKLNENLCKNDTNTIAFKCIDTQLKELYEDGSVWFLIYHDRYTMHKQKTLFDAVKGVRIIRSGSISKIDHISVLKVDENVVKISDTFAKIVGTDVDIVATENVRKNDKLERKSNDIITESKQNNDGKKCSFCQKDMNGVLRRCNECKATYYCNEKCQKQHWEKCHKKECKSLKRANDALIDITNKWNKKLCLPNIDHFMNNLKPLNLCVGYSDSLIGYSLFDNIDINYKHHLLKQCIDNNKYIDRAIAVMYGMGIGDATGAPLEFLDCIRFAKKSYFDLNKNQWFNEYNRFGLKRGQWTDDAAMGLCMADSLITHKEFNGSDIRIKFWNWWNQGYNNAFKYDLQRQNRNSVGLGNNISKSIFSMKSNKKPAAQFKSKANKNDSGNGSLMRLAPVPIFYCNCGDMEMALKYAKQSSFTTHQGFIAAEACALMSFIIINGINRDESANESVKVFLDRVTNEYLGRICEEYSHLLKDNSKQKNKSIKRQIFAKDCIIKLLNGKESNDSKERCWNWRSKTGELGIDITMIQRGHRYNGYPNAEGYFGSYCMDGIAMGLHSVYNSDSFGNAIENAVNLLGDADSTGSIAGQIAGSYYGFKDVFYNKNGEEYLFKQILQWDRYDFGVRAVLLYCIGRQ